MCCLSEVWGYVHTVRMLLHGLSEVHSCMLQGVFCVCVLAELDGADGVRTVNSALEE
jgi:hypothetical protein